MKTERESEVRQSRIGIVAAVTALLLLISCNGDPLNTGTVGSSSQAPTITSSPQSITAIPGQSATFTVSASGTSPLTYQWQRGGSDIAGATQASYTLPSVSASDSGAVFTATVSNTFGSVTSSGATLTVQTMQ
jgi:hypothetical protein